MSLEDTLTLEQEKVLLNIRESMINALEADFDQPSLSDERRAEIKDNVAVLRAELAYDRVLIERQLSK